MKDDSKFDERKAVETASLGEGVFARIAATHWKLDHTFGPVALPRIPKSRIARLFFRVLDSLEARKENALLRRRVVDLEEQKEKLEYDVRIIASQLREKERKNKVPNASERIPASDPEGPAEWRESTIPGSAS